MNRRANAGLLALGARVLMGALLACAPASARKAHEPVAPPEIRPMAARADQRARFQAAMRDAGKTGAATEQECDLLAEQLSICYVKGTTGDLDYVTAADLAAWAMSPEALRDAAQRSALQGFSANRPAASAVEGVAGTWWLSAEADGLDAAGLLHPDRLAQIAGKTPVVAVPAQGALLFWVPGDPELDKVMAVAARRIYDGADQRVSPLVYQWAGDHWEVWGEATPAERDPLQR